MVPFNWQSVKTLHVEISSLCNAACPACPRYSTHGYESLPHIDNSWRWSFNQTITNLPKEKLKYIKSYLVNGSHGDFLTNPDALKIIQYFRECSPDARISINTNGGARSSSFWKSLASIVGNSGKTFFAIDGLADTHSIYRRKTIWETVVNNAKTYMESGGTAVWAMTQFDFNQHQIESCKKISEELGFSEFYLRKNTRPNLIVKEKHKIIRFDIDRDFFKHGSKYDLKTNEQVFDELAAKQQQIDDGVYVPYDDPSYIPNLIKCNSQCESYRDSSIFITGDFKVLPCCHIGGSVSNRQTDIAYHKFIEKAAEHGLKLSDFVPSESNPIDTIVNEKFKWIFDSMYTSDILRSCSEICAA